MSCTHVKGRVCALCYELRCETEVKYLHSVKNCSLNKSHFLLKVK